MPIYQPLKYYYIKLHKTPKTTISSMKNTVISLLGTSDGSNLINIGICAYSYGLMAIKFTFKSFILSVSLNTIFDSFSKM